MDLYFKQDKEIKSLSQQVEELRKGVADISKDFRTSRLDIKNQYVEINNYQKLLYGEEGDRKR